MLACFSVAGCESQIGAGVASPEALRDTMNSRFVGGPLSAVVARYGMPDSQFMLGEIRVLQWHTTNTMRFHEPVTTTTRGSVGGEYPWLDSVPYRESTTTSQGYNVDYACAMQVGVRSDGTVDAIGFDGKMGACQNFMP